MGREGKSSEGPGITGRWRTNNTGRIVNKGIKEYCNKRNRED